MKKSINKGEFFRGLIAGVAAFAILLGMEAVENYNPAAKPAAKPLAAGESVYTASANGFGGPVEVTLTVGEDGAITDVSIVGESETPDVGGAAIPELAAQVLAAQSADQRVLYQRRG